jgi:hypothetical protein
VNNFEVGGKYNLLIKEELKDIQFIWITDAKYDINKWFIDDDYFSGSNKTETLQWDYNFVIKWDQFILSKRKTTYWTQENIEIKHSDLAQWENVNYAWEINFQWGNPESFNNKSWHYLPWVEWSELLIQTLKNMWYTWRQPIFYPLNK